MTARESLLAAIAAHKLYRPSSGTEGADFITEWCCECERDINEDCPILANSFAYNIDEPGYPQEWRYGKSGPECTAYVERGKPIPNPIDTLTPDLFDAAIDAARKA